MAVQPRSQRQPSQGELLPSVGQLSASSQLSQLWVQLRQAGASPSPVRHRPSELVGSRRSGISNGPGRWLENANASTCARVE